MKIRTKFLAAVLAVATAFSCALTASAFTKNPGLTLQGNESSPLTLNNGEATATLTLKASDFNEVKGAKITVELPSNSEKITLSNITVEDADNTWTLGENNYRVVGNKITMVDVFNFNDGNTASKENLNLNLNFKVTNASIGKYEIKVTGDFADEAADKVYTVPTTANFVIGREETSESSLDNLNDSIKLENDYFIPYGGAYIGDYNLPKASDGTFNYEGTVTGNIGILKCKMPADGKVTTFGASNSLVGNVDTSIQFGSYINKITAENGAFGTLLIASGPLSKKLSDDNYTVGTYENALKYFEGNVANLLSSIITKFSEKTTGTTNWFDGKLHPYTYGTTKEVVYAAVVPQKTYMWRDKEENREKLQYAVRCTGLDDAAKKAYVYTAVGYSLKDTTYTFSTEVQSASYNSLNPVNNQ